MNPPAVPDATRTTPAVSRPTTIVDDTDEDTDALLDRLVTCDHPPEWRRIYAVLVRRYCPLVTSIAAHYRGHGVEWDDLVQVGRLALCKAILGYRSGRGSGFVAYAVPTIEGEIKRHFRDHAWDIRPPRRLRRLQRQVREQEDRLSQEMGRRPSSSELACALHLDSGALHEVRSAPQHFRTVSLDAPATQGSASWSDRLGTREHAYEMIEVRLTLRSAIDSLSRDEQRLVYLRFMCDMTQQAIADQLGTNQMQVSRSLRRIMSKLRSYVEPLTGTA